MSIKVETPLTLPTSQSWALLPSSNLKSSVAADEDTDDEAEKENTSSQSLHVRTASSLWNFISSLGIHQDQGNLTPR